MCGGTSKDGRGRKGGRHPWKTEDTKGRWTHPPGGDPGGPSRRSSKPLRRSPITPPPPDR